MGFMLANVDGRGALVDGEHYFDVATISDETLPSDPMLVLAHAVELTALAGTLAGREPTGAWPTSCSDRRSRGRRSRSGSDSTIPTMPPRARWRFRPIRWCSPSSRRAWSVRRRRRAAQRLL